MKRILITGVGGYVGQETARLFLEEGYAVIGTGSATERPTALPREVEYEPADIRDHDRLTAILKRERIETVCHLAGQKRAGLCEDDPAGCFSVNVGGTAALLLAMREAGAPHLIYASTWLVYDLKENGIFYLDEGSAVGPVSVYGRSKLIGEEMIRQCHEKGALARYHIMRYGNIVGPGTAQGASSASFLEYAVSAAKTGREVEIFGSDFDTKDGTVARDLIDVQDAAAANAAAAAHVGHGTYNIAGGRAVTLKHLLDLVADRSGRKLSIKIGPRRGAESASITLDVSAAKKDLAWRPIQDIAATIDRFFSS